MDLSGRSAGYRGAAIRCPGCAEPMTLEALAECDVDVCGSCGGIWIDWFDGEVRAVATEMLARELRPSDPGGMRNEARAIGACPRCTRHLVSERYVVKTATAHAKSAQETGADLLRCEECAGAFVSRTAAETLSTLPPDEAPPTSEGAPSSTGRVLDPLPWQKLMAAIRRLVGLP